MYRPDRRELTGDVVSQLDNTAGVGLHYPIGDFFRTLASIFFFRFQSPSAFFLNRIGLSSNL